MMARFSISRRTENSIERDRSAEKQLLGEAIHGKTRFRGWSKKKNDCLTVWSCLGLALLLGPSVAAAADPFAKRVAKAQNCYERKLYDCTINELEAAYLIRPMPALLLNIAHAYLDYGRPRDAIVYYDRYMVEEKNLAPEARADVEKFKRQAEEKLQAMQSAVQMEQPPDTTTPKVESPPPVPEPPVVSLPPPVPSSPSAAAKWLPIGTMALGGALLVSGIAVGGAAMSAAKTAVATDAPYNADTDARGKTLNNAAIALDVVGGLAIAGGLIPILFRAAKPKAQAIEAPNSQAISVSFSNRSVVVFGRF